MTNAAIAADFDEPLDVHGDFTPEVALYLAVMINVLSQFVNIRFGQILDPDVGVNAGLAKDVLSGAATDTVDIGQPDLNSFFPGQVYAAYTRPIECLPP